MRDRPVQVPAVRLLRVIRLPWRPRLDARFDARAKHAVAAIAAAVHDERREPVAGAVAGRFLHPPQIPSVRKRLAIPRVYTALGREEIVNSFELGESERGIQAGQPVVEADVIMTKVQGIVFRLRRQVLGAPRNFVVIRDDDAACTAGDDLVAVEAERRDAAERADFASLVLTAEPLGRILYERET